jgi:hypothetical protein
MDIQTLIEFFKWCTIINAAMLVFVGIMFLLIPGFIYRLHTHWFEMPREAFNVVIYSALTFFKIIFIFFNVVPWIVLEVIA